MILKNHESHLLYALFDEVKVEPLGGKLDALSGLALLLECYGVLHETVLNYEKKRNELLKREHELGQMFKQNDQQLAQVKATLRKRKEAKQSGDDEQKNLKETIKALTKEGAEYFKEATQIKVDLEKLSNEENDFVFDVHQIDFIEELIRNVGEKVRCGDTEENIPVFKSKVGLEAFLSLYNKIYETEKELNA